MTLDDFRAAILPALGRFDLLDVEDLDGEVAELLWQASRPYGEWTPAVKHEVRDARDALLGRVPEDAVNLARELRTNYEALTHAAASGVTHVRITVRPDCRCLEPLEGVQLPVHAALRAFLGEASVPLLPPPEAPCFQCESAKACSVRVVPARYAPQPGDDPEFAEVLAGILAPAAKPLPENWAECVRRNAGSSR